MKKLFLFLIPNVAFAAHSDADIIFYIVVVLGIFILGNIYKPNKLKDTKADLKPLINKINQARKNKMVRAGKEHAGYTGESKNNMRHGYGIELFMDGEIYEGEFRDDKRHGYGIFRYTNLDIYEGGWENDVYHGQGIFRYSNESCFYEGRWVDGKRCGYGHEKRIDANYKGEFEANEMHGYGILTYHDNSLKFIGEFKKGNMDGKGTYTSEDIGGTYIGDFKNNKFHGHGRLVKENGDIMNGEWKNNNFIG
ncbi:hypothetical protein OAQ60_02710 [Methylophilaceae bacterium]|nr:hypothetical protein [Methylophilaceae bacterium]